MNATAFAAVLVAAVSGCCPVDECRMPAIERVDAVAFEEPSPSRCARPSGAPLTWDFTKGIPAGGKLNKFARVDAAGLSPADPTNMSAKAGFALDRFFTPPGAFLFEAEFVPGTLGAPGTAAREGILWDDLAITYKPKRSNRGFQLSLDVRDGVWHPRLWVGFSNDTANVAGPAVALEPGKPASISFLFGANGRVIWEFAGKRLDTRLAISGPLAPSTRYKPVIGDRAVSNYHQFDGTIRRVSITPCKTETFVVGIDGRAAFVRGETNATVTVVLDNKADEPFDASSVTVEQFVDSGRARKETFAAGQIVKGSPLRLSCGVETRLRPGWHTLRVTVCGKDAAGGELREERVFRLGIGPAHADRMTALMWGYRAPQSVLADYGFTHGLSYLSPCAPGSGSVYDEALVQGVELAHSMRVTYPNDDVDSGKYLRKTRQGNTTTHGKKQKPVPEVSNPEMQAYIREIAAKDAAMFRDYPAFAGVLPCSEVRDGTFPSFNTEHLRYEKETGRKVPPQVERKVMHVSKVGKFKEQFPDGVVPVDDPVLAYYRWFWKGGDGWPSYTGGAAEEYRSRISRPNFFVFWDPAVRCPPIWGSGGAVDMLNQWVYAVPEPMNVAGPAEEILAMAAGRPGQRPAIMTQLICYRAQIAPKDKKVSPEPEWVRRRPDADFPTIPPDTLQEATWSMIAKPVQAIMYHGWGTIYETGAATGYTYTNPESTDRIKHLLKEVVAPLGPTLKRLGRTPPPVAVLESFTTCVLGGPASWGWKVPAVTFFQRARLDPRVVYEETILRDGLDGVKVLYAPQCMFLTPPVVEKIKAFQANGGTLVADDQLLSALKADIVVPVVSFSPPPKSDHTEDVNAMEAAREGDEKTRRGTMRAKARMTALAAELRKNLASRYTPAVDSSSSEIVTYSRRWNDTRYVFAINDHRTFGDYVGPWGLTMEKGLPFKGEVSMQDDGSVKAVYELSRGGEVPFTREGGRVKVPVSYETNDGRLFAFLETRIASVKVDAPRQVRRGGVVTVTLSALDEGGQPVKALLPAEIRLFAADGRELDGAGWVCLQGGICTIDIQTNLDDADGGYRLVCRDRASGMTVERTIAVR